MANQVMLELDADARVLKANAHACRLYGYSTAEFEGLDLRRLMQDDGRNLPDLMARIARDGTVTERQHRRTKTGGSVWVDCTFNAMKDPQGGIDRITVVCVDVTEAVLRIEAAERNQQAHRAAQTRVVDALGSALSRLAEGDMTTALDDPFEPEYEMLRANFNTAVQQLDRALSGVVTGAANIRNGAAEITEAADDLSRRTESQAATLEETAAALDMLTASVKASALGADEADRAVTEAREHAESSGSVVVEAVAAMGEIEQSSRQIRQIIGVIDDIAFQTNLLALNAGVEAARAGDAGRGFAVVASEVRALAQRSSEAAREIKDLISASSRHVEKGVGLVGETGEALKAIVQGVSQIATRVSAIAQSARAQATGLSEINSGMGNMDQVTQQNAAMVEESTAASHSLRSEAEALAGGVAHFRLRGTAPDQRRAVPAAAPVLASAARQTRPKLAASAARPAEWEEF
nr:methyl-accepting chemotaxis protein [Gemmobacter straminiformis]